MLINQKQLKNLEVKTQAGQNLGQVVDFELETDTGKIMKYHVKSKSSITVLFKNKLIINHDQIISFNDKEIIVEDNAIKEEESLAVKQVKKIEGADPVITSKEV